MRKFIFEGKTYTTAVIDMERQIVTTEGNYTDKDTLGGTNPYTSFPLSEVEFV